MLDILALQLHHFSVFPLSQLNLPLSLFLLLFLLLSFLSLNAFKKPEFLQTRRSKHDSCEAACNDFGSDRRASDVNLSDVRVASFDVLEGSNEAQIFRLSFDPDFFVIVEATSDEETGVE